MEIISNIHARVDTRFTVVIQTIEVEVTLSGGVIGRARCHQVLQR
jgi:hypothetical protein